MELLFDTTELKKGDKFDLLTFECYEHLCNGGLVESYGGKAYYNTKVKYITPTKGLILELVDKDALTDDGIVNSLYTGAEIKKYFSDFDGEDDETYSVTYEENSPFY